MQIDYVSFLTGARPELCPGYSSGWQQHVDPQGELVRRFPAFLPILGTYDDRLVVKTPDPCTLYLSGNPVKFFQGHNLFGSSDALGLALAAGLAVRQSVGMFPGPSTFQACEFYPPRFTRLDITRSYRFASESEALAYIRLVAAQSRSRHGAAVCKGDTVYFGQHSRRWSFKIYPKLQELRAHPPRGGPALDHLDKLQEWTQGVVRFELTLRSPELEELPPRFDLLTTWQTYFDKLTLNENAIMTQERTLLEQALKPYLQTSLQSWRSGLDLRQVYPRRTFYRIRKQLLDQVGVDIAQAPVRDAENAPPASLEASRWDPEPIRDSGLYFEPSPELEKQYGLL